MKKCTATAGVGSKALMRFRHLVIAIVRRVALSRTLDARSLLSENPSKLLNCSIAHLAKLLAVQTQRQTINSLHGLLTLGPAGKHGDSPKITWFDLVVRIAAELSLSYLRAEFVDNNGSAIRAELIDNVSLDW